jgi:hypothetical protein
MEKQVLSTIRVTSLMLLLRLKKGGNACKEMITKEVIGMRCIIKTCIKNEAVIPVGFH